MPFARWRKFQAGVGKGRPGFVGLLSTLFGPVNSATASETTLFSTTIPANTLYKNGFALKFRAWGTYAANANNKQVKCYLGATVLYDTSALTANGVGWVLNGMVVRTGSKTQTVWAKFIDGITNVLVNVISPTLDDTTDLTLKVTAIAATAAADVVGQGFTVEVLSV